MTMTTLRTLALLFGAALVASCGDPANQIFAVSEPNGTTRIRFFNFSDGSPSVHFYAGDTKLAGVAEVGFTQDPKTGVATGGTEGTGTAFTGVTSGGFYNSIAPGTYTFNARIGATTDNGLKIANLNTTIASNKKYSVYLAGQYDAATKSSDAFIVEDPYSESYDWNNAQVRFVNAGSNTSGMTLYAKNQTTSAETAIGGDVVYKGASTFYTLAPGTYDFRAAPNGTTANVVTRTAVSLTAGKIYTITFRGRVGGASTAAPFLDNTANK